MPESGSATTSSTSFEAKKTSQNQRIVTSIEDNPRGWAEDEYNPARSP